MTVKSLILIEGSSVTKASLNISLTNALQVVIGRAPAMGWIVHVAANSNADLGKALLKFAQVPNVTGVTTLLIRN
ncbi:MAG: hypothetical protein QOD32_997 [Pyrinomonadaceae bacterium]|jgi:hypothetical protein|nr:hypothetical protein [Pyrinomonadaceae bacterium]